MPNLTIRREGGILWLEPATRNRTLTWSFIREMSAFLKEEGGEVLVIGAEDGRLFSPGLDLQEVSALDWPAMEQLIADFEELYLNLYVLGRPTIAMLDGHAVGGGFILASACDFRVGTPQIRVGMTEMNHVVPLPYSAVSILRPLLPHSHLLDLLCCATRWSGEEAGRIGWLHRVVPRDALPHEVRALAERLGQQSRDSFLLSKAFLKEEVYRQARRGARERRRQFLSSWFSQAAVAQRERLLKRLREGAGEEPPGEGS